MDEEGGFYIEFSNCEDIKAALDIVNEKIMYIDGWDANVNENIIGVYDDSPVEYDAFEGIFEKICKAVAKAQPEDVFDGSATYEDKETKEQAADRVHYENHKLTVENIFSTHEAVCPECGEKEIYLEDYIPGEPIHCNVCGFKMAVEDVYGTAPDYEKHEVEI